MFNIGKVKSAASDPDQIVKDDRILPYETSIKNLLNKYSDLNVTSLGQLTMIIDGLPREQGVEIWKQIEPIQADFWTYWDDIRKKYYEANIRPFGIRVDVASFFKPKNGDLIIDIAGNRGAQIPYIIDELINNDPSAKIGFLVMDQNPEALSDATQELAKCYDHLFYAKTVIANYEQISAEIKNKLPEIQFDTLRILNCYGLYQPLSIFTQRLEPIFDFGLKLGKNTDLSIVVLNPHFDPKELWNKFDLTIAPKLVSEGKKQIVDEAKIALPFIVDHSIQVKKIMPIWEPNQISSYLKSHGYILDQTTEILKGESDIGQSVCLKFRK
jgi:hypothetical protein